MCVQKTLEIKSESRDSEPEVLMLRLFLSDLMMVLRWDLSLASYRTVWHQRALLASRTHDNASAPMRHVSYICFLFRVYSSDGVHFPTQISENNIRKLLRDTKIFFAHNFTSLTP